VVTSVAVRVLAVDTSSSTGSVALVEAGPDPFAVEVVATASARVSNAHGESLLPLIDAVLKSARIERASIDLLAVGIGPGSFTGTRIAVATMKGIAIATGKPLRGVDAFASLAADCGVTDDRPIAVAIDARKGEVYVSAVRVTGGDVVSLVAPAHLAPDRAFAYLAPAIGEVFCAIGDGVRLVPELAMHLRQRVEAEVPRAPAVAALAAARHNRHSADEVDVLEPLYVRPPDVTIPTRTPGLPRSNVGSRK
jgi:tRNA threonylcarbamoyladenosine biosynthesis protein TsaB